ncbi:MAG: efflux transporter periplasmic adaptor subunit [Gammaproteobacteria bacterium]|nr:efflux transporter periplasmic adaptor subunit [Gammaproteobacteria bacterium]
MPRDAVIRDGEGEHVILALGEGRFEPRTIMTGIESDGRVEILEGLADDDQVVVSAQFLLDSEASLKASFRRMTPMEKRTISPLPPSPLEGRGSGVGHVEMAP